MCPARGDAGAVQGAAEEVRCDAAVVRGEGGRGGGAATRSAGGERGVQDTDQRVVVQAGAESYDGGTGGMRRGIQDVLVLMMNLL